jgi:hypothetical protein
MSSLGSRLGLSEVTERVCVAPHHITRLVVYSGRVVDALAAACSDGTLLARAGGPGGAPLTLDLPFSGVGRLRVRAGALVDAVGGIGGSGGTERVIECADGYRIGGFGIVVGDLPRAQSRIILGVRFLCTAAAQPAQHSSLNAAGHRDAPSHAPAAPAEAEPSATQPEGRTKLNLLAIAAVGSLAILGIACIWPRLGTAAPAKDL